MIYQDLKAHNTELLQQLKEKEQKLSDAEDQVIKLSKRCAEIMTQDLKSGQPAKFYGAHTLC